MGGILQHWKLVLIGLLLIVAGGFAFAWNQALDAKREAELGELNAVAKLDTTREVLEDWQDSTDVYQRLAVQRKLERDSLDEALDQESRARARLAIRLDSVSVRDTTAGEPVTEDSAGVRHASLHLREEPVTLDVSASVPAPPDTARWDVRLLFDPLTLEARISCADVHGMSVRQASVEATVPNYTQGVTVEDVVTDPEVCNPPRPRGINLLGLDVPAVPVLGGVALLSFVLGVAAF